MSSTLDDLNTQKLCVAVGRSVRPSDALSLSIVFLLLFLSLFIAKCTCYLSSGHVDMQTKPTGVCSLFLSLVSYLVTWVSQTLASTLPKEFKVPSGWDLSSVSFPSHLYSCPVVRMMICFTFTHLSHIWGERWLGAGLRELVLSFYHVCAGETQVISFAH